MQIKLTTELKMAPYFNEAPIKTMADIYQLELRFSRDYVRFTWDDSPIFRIGDDGSVWNYSRYAF